MRILIVILCILLSSSLFGAKERYTDFNSNIVAGSHAELFDGKYNDMLFGGWETNFTNHKVSSYITLALNSDALINSDVSLQVKLQITYWVYGTGGFQQEQVLQTLTVNYSSLETSVIDAKQTLVKEGAHRVSYEIVAITSTNSSQNVNFHIETAIDVERYYHMSSYVITGNIGVMLAGINNEKVKFYWPYHYGAEEYELEYVFESNLSHNVFTEVTSSNASNVPFDFELNSTRIRTSNNFYEIPAIFNRGFIYFRIRPIGRQGSEFQYRLEGDWNITKDGVGSSMAIPSLQITQDYNVNKNWIQEVSYTEEGKRFESVSYVDGFGRPRQTIVGDVDKELVLISNVYYDNQGRAFVGTKAYPEQAYSFDFRANNDALNNQGIWPVSENNFNVNGLLCETPLVPFDTQGQGVGSYFSTHNVYYEGENAFIPDARGFVYDRLKMSDDPYGNAVKVGSYGYELQLDKHDQWFAYTNPDQEEISKLFGSEVGYANQYIKDYYLDANGQYHISYKDIQGRVIANGLTGDKPKNLDKLPNNLGNTEVNSLFYDGSTQTFSDGLVANLSKDFILENDQEVVFTHSFTMEDFTSLCHQTSCFDCIYDLTVKIIDDCGTQHYFNQEQISGENYNKMCDGTNDYSHDITLFLTGGDITYTLIKELSVNQEAAGIYFCEYYDESTCIDSYSTIFNELYDPELLDCEEETSPSIASPCDAKRKLMAMQMSIGGQYGSINPSDDTYALSVYNTNSQLPNLLNLPGRPLWKRPDDRYTNLDGSEARIYLQLSSGVYSPQIDLGTEVLFDSDNQPYVYPENLSNLSDFITYSQSSWGEALVIHHPEYCYLKYCETTTEFEAYKQLMLQTNFYDDACSTGLFNPLGTQITGSFQQIPNSANTALFLCNENFENTYDTYFISGHYGQILPYIQQYYTCFQTHTYQGNNRLVNFFAPDPNFPNSYLTIWETALWMNSPYTNLSDVSSIRSAIGTWSSTMDECTKNAVWYFFREKYLAIREESFLLARTLYMIDDQVMGCSYPALNSCFGVDNFTKFIAVDCLDPDNFPNANGPCSDATSSLYANVEPVFGASFTGTGVVNSDITDEIAEFSQDMCEQACTQQAIIWMENLEACQGNLTSMKTELVALCIANCNEDNPLGATTAQNADPNGGPRDTFKEIIGYWASNENSNLCSEYLISDPKPYGENDVENSSIVLDDCGCDKIQNAQNTLLAGTYPSITSLNEMMQYLYQVYNPNVEQLLCTCNKMKGNSATWTQDAVTALLDLSIEVDAALSCNTIDCFTCTEIQAKVDEFTLLFPGLNEQSINYQALYANFLNQELGFNASYYHYQFFLEGCNLSPSEYGCSLNTLGKTLKDMIELIIIRGQLLTSQNSSINLIDENIVYALSGLATVMQTPYYYSTVNGNEITMHFGSTPGSSEKQITFSLGQNISDFSKIIGLGALTVDGGCGSAVSLSINTEYLGCNDIEAINLGGAPIRQGGVPSINNEQVSISFNGFDIIDCYCGDTPLTICAEAENVFIPNTCYQFQLNEMIIQTESILQQQLNQARIDFIEAYNNKCKEAFSSEKIEQKKNQNNYQFTLYYYDLAGNLIQTVAPEGVNQYDETQAQTAYQQMVGNQDQIPSHTFKTKYEYNSFNQVVSMTHPDLIGEVHNWYDYYGRNVFTQNPSQAQKQLYTYYLYDELNRMVETGQVKIIGALPDLSIDDLGLSLISFLNVHDRFEVTKIKYDRPENTSIVLEFKNQQQTNLRNAVSCVKYYNQILPGVTAAYQSAIHYSYDPHGNMIEQLQETPLLAQVNQQFKSTQYQFELLSGNTTKVSYQEAKDDQHTQVYLYDRMNRLREVEFSSDNVHFSREAHYHFYDYGPLSRTEIGENQVQGMDFAYTIQGWLKAKNAAVLDPQRDMGRDGITGYYSSNNTIHQPFAKDVFAGALGYFKEDYKSISGLQVEIQTANSDFNELSPELFDGSLRYTVNSIKDLGTLANSYQYDQLYRLKSTNAFTPNDPAMWNHELAIPDYKTNYTYNKNGSLKSIQRNGIDNGGHFEMDDMSYNYIPGTNKLDKIIESQVDSPLYDDFKKGNQGGSHPYKYNNIGQLTDDDFENLKYEWYDGNKKIKLITPAANKPLIEFQYNPMGQRSLKIVKPRSGNAISDEEFWEYTYYSYDAGGQLLAVYDLQLSSTQKEATLSEQHIYGAERLGMRIANKLLYDNGIVNSSTAPVFTHQQGLKRYEITGYQQNVHAVISDRKVPNLDNSSQFEAVVYMTADYYAYGMIMPKRHVNNSDYRYGYNGMEQDMEEKGPGNTYTTEFRQYDPRIGMWMSLDPMMLDYPSWSPYVAFNDNPIMYIDPQGLFGLCALQSAMGAVGNLAGSYAFSAAVMGTLDAFDLTGMNGMNGMQSFGGGDTFGDQDPVKRPNPKLTKNSFNKEFGSRKAVHQPLVLQSKVAKKNTVTISNPSITVTSSYLTNNYHLYSQPQGCSSCGILDPFIELAEEGISNTLQYFGMSENSANYAAFGILFIGSAATGKVKAAKGGSQGGLNLFKWGAEQTGKSTGWKAGDYMLHLPNKGTPKLNWKANYGALRSEMNLGKPIFDSYRLPNGNLIPTGGFLNAERYILQSRGWMYNPGSGAWMPPIR